MAVRRETKKRASRAAQETEAAPEPVATWPSPAPTPAPADAAAASRSTSLLRQGPRRRSPARAPHAPRPSYTVVARRYRPQRFEDVVGQDHVVQSLRNAIRLNRIAQAYLFCGTRGVGKTSMARIFAKCLNCVKGPTESPCQTCDICQAIAVGQDVDVIEIDGASNNGVEQVRELRQNASLRPSRSRYKIYYIDEVHMLSTGAFNALLKTLEEPPPHVKFLFATTEPNKIPITVLSRCQRYDFAGITPEAIAGDAGRDLHATRGSSLSPRRFRSSPAAPAGRCATPSRSWTGCWHPAARSLTVEVVHTLLGTATDERLLTMLEALADHDAAAALRLLEQGAGEGVQPAELLGGLIDLIRDAMVLAVGAESMLLAVSPRNRHQLKASSTAGRSSRSSLRSRSSAECRSRMRGSVHGRLLLETALVRVARLEELTSLSTLVERLAALESGAHRRRSRLWARPREAKCARGSSSDPARGRQAPCPAGAGSASSTPARAESARSASPLRPTGRVPSHRRSEPQSRSTPQARSQPARRAPVPPTSARVPPRRAPSSSQARRSRRAVRRGFTQHVRLDRPRAPKPPSSGQCLD